MPSAPFTFLFDLDGTLIDSIELILSSYEHTMSVHRGESPPRETFLRGLGVPLATQFRVFTDDNDEVDAMIATYRAHNLRLHDSLVRSFDGVVDALARIRAQGSKIGVVTNKLGAAARRGLRVCGFDGLVDVVVAIEDVVEHKPHPEPIQKAMQQLGADPAETITIGDSPLDLMAGRAAGTRTGAVLWGPFERSLLEPHAPDYWFADPEEFLEL